MKIIRSFAGKTTTNFETIPIKPVIHQTFTDLQIGTQEFLYSITGLFGVTKALSIRCLNHVINQLAALLIYNFIHQYLASTMALASYSSSM